MINILTLTDKVAHRFHRRANIFLCQYTSNNHSIQNNIDNQWNRPNKYLFQSFEFEFDFDKNRRDIGQHNGRQLIKLFQLDHKRYNQLPLGLYIDYRRHDRIDFHQSFDHEKQAVQYFSHTVCYSVRRGSRFYSRYNSNRLQTYISSTIRDRVSRPMMPYPDRSPVNKIQRMKSLEA